MGTSSGTYELNCNVLCLHRTWIPRVKSVGGNTILTKTWHKNIVINRTDVLLPCLFSKNLKFLKKVKYISVSRYDLEWVWKIYRISTRGKNSLIHSLKNIIILQSVHRVKTLRWYFKCICYERKYNCVQYKWNKKIRCFTENSRLYGDRGDWCYKVYSECVWERV